MTQKKYFGTDGVRGKVGGDVMNAECVSQLGFAIGSVLSQTTKNPSVVIGRDTRESGLLLQDALEMGLISAGVSIITIGVMPTPAVAYFTQKLNADAGIVITASHNPYEDNGVKLIAKNGAKFSDNFEKIVEEKMAELTSAYFSKKKNTTTLDNAQSDYILHCASLFPTLNLSDFKIIIDCGNGAAFETAPALFSQLHAKAIAIHNTPNGKNINDHCGATHLDSLQKTVLSEKADLGIALDGDGDRLILVDHKGEVVDGDEILGILALHNKHKAVVGTLMSNLGLEKALESAGILFERVAVGDRYVLEKLHEKNWKLGGEASGHIINLHYAQTGDAVLTALQILKIMQDEKKSLHELKKYIHKRPQILINVPVANPNNYKNMPEIQKAVLETEKKLNGSGRVLLRASGTESCVRVMIECDDSNQARELSQFLAKIVESVFR